MTQLIGINGFKQSGKGTVAGIIRDIHEGIAYEIGFADKLKIMAAQAIGFDRPPRELIALMDEAKLGWEFGVVVDGIGSMPWHSFTGREYLQQFGTRARENFGSDFWVDQVLPNPANVLQGGIEEIMEHELYRRYPDIDCVVFTDLRFENEAERVKVLGGSIIEVIRPGVESDGHASEQKLPAELVDYTIHNDSGLPQLVPKVDEILACLR